MLGLAVGEVDFRRRVSVAGLGRPAPADCDGGGIGLVPPARVGPEGEAGFAVFGGLVCERGDGGIAGGR